MTGRIIFASDYYVSMSCGAAIVITHPDKLLFPDDGITKGDLARYYETLAPVILPHLRGRPITMERYPAGINAKGFWQKDVSKGFPAWLQRVEVAKRTVSFITCRHRRDRSCG